MANHKGSEGTVHVVSAAIAELRSWELEITADTLEDTTMGDAIKTRQPSLTDASGSCEAYWDETDTSGQGAMTAGAEVVLNMYPEGATTGDTYFTGSVLITAIRTSAAHDGMVESSFSWVANGGMAEATVA